MPNKAQRLPVMPNVYNPSYTNTHFHKIYQVPSSRPSPTVVYKAEMPKNSIFTPFYYVSWLMSWSWAAHGHRHSSLSRIITSVIGAAFDCCYHCSPAVLHSPVYAAIYNTGISTLLALLYRISNCLSC
jgi:hypothetical protein